MPADQTKEQLLDAAERLFANAGFEGASLRAITAEAGTDLGSVRYHFGSKTSLLKAVLLRRLAPLNETRLTKLQRLEAVEKTMPSVEEILGAFIEPAFALLSHPEHGVLWIKLLARLRVDPSRFIAPTLPHLKRVSRAYLDALGRALPQLPEEELKYRWYFFFGSHINTLLDLWSPKTLDIASVYEDPARVMDRLLDYAATALRAPASTNSP